MNDIDALAALKDKLNRERTADQLVKGDRIEWGGGTVRTVDGVDEWNCGTDICLIFKETAEPWFGPADSAFHLAD